ncbi:MAG TPA: cell envelope integrity protein TolA [Paenalcaligenes sp.]|nr:cell envelope integrity protein TolA [Paenalcaligenes sp.]
MTKQFYDANDKKDQRRGLIYAISLHVALFLLLLAGLLNAPRNPSPVQIELWAEGDLQVEEEPGGDVNFDEVEEIDELDETSAMDEPTVNDEQTESEPTESETPETEDQPEPTTDDTDPVEQDTAQPDQSNQSQDLPPEKDPDIALAKAEKERQEREEEERRAREEAERKAKEEEERKAREEAERKAKEEEERKAREEAERKAKEEEERKAREEAERKAKEEEERKKAQLREAMQAAGREAAGIEGGTASRNQAGGGGDDGYAARLRSCIKPRVVFNTPPRRGNNNPTLQYEASLDGEGRVLGVTIVRSSGNRQFDEAVKKGIEKCSPLPTPPSGKFPNKFGGEYRMYD